MRNYVCVLAMVFTFLADGVWAQAPEAINYQAKLEVSGELITQSDVEVIFRLYDAAAAGAVLYAETQTVNVVNGFYATDIGASNAVPGSLTSALGNPSVWLEVEVDGTALSPRERLVSVPYAIQAGSVVGGVNDGDADSANELNSSVTLNGNNLQVTDAGGTLSANLAGYLDNTDVQTLSFANPNLSISGGNSVDLSALAGGGGGGGGLAVIKPSDQTNATTTLVNDNHFVFSNLQPGSYLLYGSISAVGNTNDGKVAFTFTGTGSISYVMDLTGPVQVFTTASPEWTVGSGGSPESLHGVLNVTTAGTLTFQFARFDNTTPGEAGLTVRAGSFMVVDKLN